MAAFECENCGYRNNEIQSLQSLADEGCKIHIKVLNSKDLDRQVVLTEHCAVLFEEIEFEIPPSPNRSVLTTIEGLLEKTKEDLILMQENQVLNLNFQYHLLMHFFALGK